MSVDNSLHQMAHLAEGAAGLVAAGQSAAMAVLLAEMWALRSLMPGQAVALSGQGAGAAARHLAEEAEVEAGFDNMPV